MRQMLLLDPRKTILDGALVGLGFGLLAQVLNRTHQKASGATRRIKDGLAEPRIDLIDDELRDRTGCVELTCIACRLQVLQ